MIKKVKKQINIKKKKKKKESFIHHNHQSSQSVSQSVVVVRAIVKCFDVIKYKVRTLSNNHEESNGGCR